ncbi:MAG: AAA family ATPase [Hungatella sp.]|jgi:predicted AAA+ superfamily ATPase|nr:AAA family ATPase [Hungatella sp.]
MKEGGTLELKRDIYQELIIWKKYDSGKVLELEGARQTGKTFILDKFAREYYQKYFYINMLQTSGAEYLACLEKATKWEPGETRIEKPLHKAFKLFDPEFADDKNTVVVIDEIQESAKVYSLIRQFARDFECHFIVTGSYLGKTMESEYFLPAGDIEKLTLYTLSFEEFLDALGKRELYEGVSLYGESHHEQYDELKSCYDIYCSIGGYPAVVRKYLETEDVEMCRETMIEIIGIFIDESQRYFKDILEVNLFEQIFPSIAQTMIREKKGISDLITELSSIVYHEDSGRTTKRSINRVIGWLYRSHIIGFCGQANDADPMAVSINRRFYFMDLGVCGNFLDMAGADPATIRGILSENFVYIDLVKRIKKRQIAGAAPVFGLYKDGEIDFILNNRKNYKNYGIEVKAGRAAGKTAQQLLQDRKVEAVYFLKGDTYGGMSGRTITIPIYLVGRVKYDFINE